MERVLVYDRAGSALFELEPSEVYSIVRHEEVNGEHSLTIDTTRELEIGQRILTCDARGKWREHVVYGIDAVHERPVAHAAYYCVWSLQADLMGTHVSAMPGVQTPVSASTALASVVSGTDRWSVGTVTNGNTGGASMYDTDGWTAMATFVQTWGGEIDAAITVDSKTGVTARAVDNRPAIGEQDAKRRYDFGADVASVRRTIADGPLYCRISPRGMGELNDDGTYGRRVTIESVNGGLDYLENASMVDAAKLPDGSGGWEYPTLMVYNDECETPADLLAWAQTVLDEMTTPQVTYEVDVAQLAREGIDMQGVSLGDAVQVVDRKFFGGVRLSGRVLSMDVDGLSGRATHLTIGRIPEGFSDLLNGMQERMAAVETAVGAIASGTSAYIENLLDRINAEINATGGYTYIVEGNGIRTYDHAVSDPLVGAEASAVVEIKGGTIRIANTKTAQGEWEWKTVFTSGHVAADVVTAAAITTGYIGSSGSTFIDLDNDVIQLGDQSGVWTNITNDAFDINLGNHTGGYIAHFGYGPGTGQSGTSNAAYYSIGVREAGSVVGNLSFAEGYRVVASGYASHAEGDSTIASGRGSHAEGDLTTATNVFDHAEGRETDATGGYSHAEGVHAAANGIGSHAEGGYSTASGQYSHAQNYDTIAASDYQTAIGKYNVSDSADTYALIVGNGTGSARSNALTVDWSGSVVMGGTAQQQRSANMNWSEKDTGVDLTLSNNGLSSGTRYLEWLAYDKNGYIPGGVSVSVASSGAVNTSLRSRNYDTSGNAYSNNFVLSVSKAGAKSASLDDALLYIDTNTFTDGTAVSSDTGGNGVTWRDSANATLGAVRPQFGSGYQGVQFYSQRKIGSTNYYNILGLRIDGSGNRTVYFNDAAAWLKAVMGGKSVLYNNATGSATSVTLSSSAANFNHMRIYYSTNTAANATSYANGGVSSVDVYSPNGKYVELLGAHRISDTQVQFRSAIAYVSGTSITVNSTSQGMYANISNGSSPAVGKESKTYIYRVEAWNE